MKEDLYRWKDSYYIENDPGSNTFIKGILKLLSKGREYSYLFGIEEKFCGHINAFDGPMGMVQILSSAQWANDEKYPLIEIRVIYLGDICYYATFCNESNSKFSVHTDKRGHWSNMVCNYSRSGSTFEK